MRKITVDKNNIGIRLDKFLAQEFFSLGLSRGEIMRNIRSGNVLVNNRKIKPGYVLHLNDVISYKPLTANCKLLKNPKLKIKIIYQDESIIVINKPAGLQVHPDRKESKNTVVNWLIAKFPEVKDIHDNSKDANLRPGIVHRLDKDTSGVMVIARNMKSYKELKKLFKEHKIEKKYLALVYGILKDKEGVIEKPIARAATYKKQVIAGRKTKTKIREAMTEFRVIREFRELGNYSLLEVIPQTGRMHQIRVHLFSIGHPIVGDKLYKLKNIKPIPAPRQMLHAEKIKFKLFGKNYLLESSLPDDFLKLTQELTQAGLTKNQ